jgi:hypothetical protein
MNANKEVSIHVNLQQVTVFCIKPQTSETRQLRCDVNAPDGIVIPSWQPLKQNKIGYETSKLTHYSDTFLCIQILIANLLSQVTQIRRLTRNGLVSEATERLKSSALTFFTRKMKPSMFMNFKISQSDKQHALSQECY